MKQNNIINVAIADDHEIFRDGLKLMLETAANIKIVGEASDGRELVNIVQSQRPDVVITDIKMPIQDGVEATKQIRSRFPKTQVIALSMFDDEQLILEMLEAGAIGYLLKNSDKSEVIEAINTVHSEKSYYCKYTSGRLAKLIAYTKTNNQKKQREAEFSDREKEIIKLICEACTNKEIGEKLGLSARTVEGIRMKILDKMDVKNSIGIVIEAIRMGIYSPV
jgi:DNA-binding NarL/FixJ family response regulator